MLHKIDEINDGYAQAEEARRVGREDAEEFEAFTLSMLKVFEEAGALTLAEYFERQTARCGSFSDDEQFHRSAGALLILTEFGLLQRRYTRPAPSWQLTGAGKCFVALLTAEKRRRME